MTLGDDVSQPWVLSVLHLDSPQRPPGSPSVLPGLTPARLLPGLPPPSCCSEARVPPLPNASSSAPTPPPLSSPLTDLSRALGLALGPPRLSGVEA